jgi:NAD(P)H-dependent FMN reductase
MSWSRNTNKSITPRFGNYANWSEGKVWTSPERHGARAGIMKTQIDWIPLSEGAVAEGDLHLPLAPDQQAVSSKYTASQAALNANGLQDRTSSRLRISISNAIQ